jgi:hypothetical protein
VTKRTNHALRPMNISELYAFRRILELEDPPRKKALKRCIKAIEKWEREHPRPDASELWKGVWVKA